MAHQPAISLANSPQEPFNRAGVRTSNVVRQKMNEIFISYSHKDTAFVNLLQNGLKLSDRKVWRDVDNIRGGQVLDREVGVAIDHAGLFVPVISEHFDQSSWLHHELARAIDARIHVVPVVVNGVKSPLTVSGCKQLRVSVSDDTIPATELIDVIASILLVAGCPSPSDYDYDSMDSSDAEWNGLDDLEANLVGSRWTWCENDHFSDTGMWIEFEADGRLRRSWRAEPGRWKATKNGFVVYKPHVLMFDQNLERFQGATADPTQLIAERSGVRLK